MRLSLLISAAFATLGLPGVAIAQLPRHALTSIYPAGGQVGTTVPVEVAGAEIDLNVGLTFDHPGIRAFRLTGTRFAVAIGPDVPIGPHDARLSGPLGLSGPRAFVVGAGHEIIEIEPNDSVATASPITLPALVRGRMNVLADVDSFAFDGVAGGIVSAEVQTLAIDSRMDATFRLFTPSGREILGPSDLPGPDPAFAIRLPETGRYVLQVHDLVYAGSPDHGYALAVRSGPKPARRPTPGFQPSQLATIPDAFDTKFIPESEPNDIAERAQVLSPPCAVSAKFDRPGDVDRFRFVANKGDAWIIEVLAERIGSTSDPEFQVVRLVDGGVPVDVVAGDDTADPFAGRRFPIGTLDPLARFQAPESGTYEIAVRDRDGSTRAVDGDLAYRLRVRPERPDFDLFVVPNDALNPEGTTLRAGGRTSVAALVNRRDGLIGPILVEARDLPPGVACAPVIVAANAVSAPMVLSAEAGIVASDRVIRFVGRNLSGDRKELLDPSPGRKVRREIEHDAIAGAMVWPMPAAAGDAPPIARARTTAGFALGLRDGSPFRLTASPEFAVVGQGETLEITAEVARLNGFAADVAITFADLPTGLPAPAPARIDKDKSNVALALKVPRALPPGLYSFVLRGAGPFPFSKDPNAKEKPSVSVDEPSNIVTIRVRP